MKGGGKCATNEQEAETGMGAVSERTKPDHLHRAMPEVSSLNVTVLNNFYYVMRYSMLKTFAGKYRTRISRIIRKYRHGKDFVVEYPKKNGKVGKVLFYNNGFCRNTKVVYWMRNPTTYRLSVGGTFCLVRT